MYILNVYNTGFVFRCFSYCNEGHGFISVLTIVKCYPLINVAFTKTRVHTSESIQSKLVNHQVLPNLGTNSLKIFIYIFLSYFQHDVRTLKRRVSKFIPQCDELIQFSSPSVQRVVSKVMVLLDNNQTKVV